MLQEMLGELFTPVETPEAPNRGFFKGLFGGGAQSLDREDLCKCQKHSLGQIWSLWRSTPSVAFFNQRNKNYNSIRMYSCDQFYRVTVTFVCPCSFFQSWRVDSRQGFSQPCAAHSWARWHGRYEGCSIRCSGGAGTCPDSFRWERAEARWAGREDSSHDGERRLLFQACTWCEFAIIRTILYKRIIIKVWIKPRCVNFGGN